MRTFKTLPTPFSISSILFSLLLNISCGKNNREIPDNSNPPIDFNLNDQSTWVNIVVDGWSFLSPVPESHYLRKISSSNSQLTTLTLPKDKAVESQNSDGFKIAFNWGFTHFKSCSNKIREHYKVFKENLSIHVSIYEEIREDEILGRERSTLWAVITEKASGNCIDLFFDTQPRIFNKMQLKINFNEPSEMLEIMKKIILSVNRNKPI
ncbi:MAG: hypothetical protein KBD78_11800 [Oligoflexales bacterium]|nr:hypothetical protein [Oligoflexales bacterium]